MTIHKFPIQRFEGERILLPRSAVLRHVAIQHGDVTVWVELDPHEPVVPWDFKVVGTGWDLRLSGVTDYTYGGTAITADGSFVWHVYYLKGANDVH